MRPVAHRRDAVERPVMLLPSTVPYSLHRDDDAFGQPGALYRDVLSEQDRTNRVTNIVNHLSDGVSDPVLERALDYWRKVDADLGARVAKGMAKDG